MTRRPPVDVVIPFGGRALEPVLARAGALRLRSGDTVTVVDNRARPEDAAAAPAGVRLVAAREVAGSYFARNAGARAGSAPWIVFVDADVVAPPDLIERLLDPPPGERVALVAGQVEDEEPPPGAPLAVRREAFEAVGGFREDVRSGGDADLCFRIRAAGWELELRPDAAVVHRSRRTIRRMLGQRAKHGAGAEWMSREHPGSFPRRSLAGVAWWGAGRAASGAIALARGDRDEALLGFLDGPSVLAFELGRRLPNRAKRRGG